MYINKLKKVFFAIICSVLIISQISSIKAQEKESLQNIFTVKTIKEMGYHLIDAYYTACDVAERPIHNLLNLAKTNPLAATTVFFPLACEATTQYVQYYCCTKDPSLTIQCTDIPVATDLQGTVCLPNTAKALPGSLWSNLTDCQSKPDVFGWQNLGDPNARQMRLGNDCGNYSSVCPSRTFAALALDSDGAFLCAPAS